MNKGKISTSTELPELPGNYIPTQDIIGTRYKPSRNHIAPRSYIPYKELFLACGVQPLPRAEVQARKASLTHPTKRITRNPLHIAALYVLSLPYMETAVEVLTMWLATIGLGSSIILGLLGFFGLKLVADSSIVSLFVMGICSIGIIAYSVHLEELITIRWKRTPLSQWMRTDGNILPAEVATIVMRLNDRKKYSKRPLDLYIEHPICHEVDDPFLVAIPRVPRWRSWFRPSYYLWHWV